MKTKTALRRPNKPFVFQGNERKNKYSKAIRDSPLVDIVEKNNNYILTMAAPGFKKEDFLITIHKEVLYTSAVKQTNTFVGAIDRYEYDYTKWHQSFILPADTDIILTMAKYIDGDLVIIIPKGESIAISVPLIIDVY